MVRRVAVERAVEEGLPIVQLDAVGINVDLPMSMHKLLVTRQDESATGGRDRVAMEHDTVVDANQPPAGQVSDDQRS